MNPAKKVLLSTLVAVAGWLSIGSAEAVPVLSISPTASNVAVNGTFKANLMISGLDSVGEIVSGFDLHVFFDPAILTAPALIIDLAPWGSGATLGLNFVAPGHVSFNLTAGLSDAQLDPLQGDSVLLSSINFRGAALDCERKPIPSLTLGSVERPIGCGQQLGSGLITALRTWTRPPL